MKSIPLFISRNAVERMQLTNKGMQFNRLDWFYEYYLNQPIQKHDYCIKLVFGNDNGLCKRLGSLLFHKEVRVQFTMYGVNTIWKKP